MKTSRLILLIFALALSGCCNYPMRFDASDGLSAARTVLTSPSAGEAYLGSSMKRFKIEPAIDCPPSPDVSMAPVGQPDSNGIIHYGAFVVRHGRSGEYATVYWWKAFGNPPQLRSYPVKNPNGKKIEFMWINEHVIRFDFGDGKSKTIRLNEDDSSNETEL